MRMFLVLGASLAALASTAWAQAPAAPTASVLHDLYACVDITDSAARLSCYDTATGRLHQAETQGQVAVVDRARAHELERESFGFQLPNLARLLSGGQEHPVENIQATVARVIERANNYHSFVLDNGQVWDQVEAQDARNVRTGDTINIHRAALGSYRLVSSRGGSGHRVRREN